MPQALRQDQILLSGVNCFSVGACKGHRTPTVHLGPPHISESIRARKLKFYKRLGMVKYSFRV